jgi:hypothetical protein
VITNIELSVNDGSILGYEGIRDLRKVVDDGRNEESPVYMLRSEELVLADKVRQARSYLKARGLHAVTYGRSGDPSVYSFHRYFKPDSKDLELARYFLLNPEEENITFDTFYYQDSSVSQHRILVSSLPKRGRRPMPDMTHGTQSILVSDRFKVLLQNSGFIGLSFSPVDLMAKEGPDEPVIPWENYELEPYWYLSTDIRMPPRSERWTAWETQTLQDEADLLYTRHLHKQDFDAIAQIEPFDLAGSPWDIRRPNGNLYLYCSHRFASFCEDHGIALSKRSPVFVLDPNANPIA